ncbi:MAG: lysoplasmalogenase [Deltaproteobacteria bacterium]|jgi:alkenylglycerophosphocholine/alkenylglycerophosphoethanolamine hydrolase|nr:lysoplasmalogenase [Deltaproteobacteria bacterium]
MSDLQLSLGAKRALTGLAAAAALSFLSAQDGWDPALRTGIKVVPCTVMAILALVGADSRPRRLLGAGLALSVLGDALLEWSDGLFIPGLLAFLTAHLLYIAGLALQWPGWAPLRGLPGLVFAGAVFALLLPGLGPLTIPVGVYSLVIAAMLWRATLGIGRPGVDPTLARLAAAGALLFVVSDAILAINKFATPLPLARLLNMSSYWGGQALLCAAALHLPPGDPAHAHPR